MLPILARRLDPTDLGVLALAQTAVTLGWITGGSWLAAAVIREFPRGGVDFAATLRRGFLLVLGALAAYALVLLPVATFSSAVADNLVLIAAAATGLVLQNIAASLFAAELRPRAFAVVDVLARTGGIGAGVFLVFTGHGVAGYLFGLAAASLAVGVLGLAAAWPRGLARFDGRPNLKPWLLYGFPGTVATLGAWALAFVDRYLLAALKDANAVGVYSIGNMIGDKAVAIPAAALLTATSPLLVAAYERSGRGEVERLIRAYTRVVLLIGLPVVAFVASASASVVVLLAGSVKFHEAAVVAPFVAIGSFVYALALIGSTGLMIARRSIFIACGAFIGVVVNVIANLLLIPPFGITGAAVATPIGMIAFLLGTQIWSRRYATWHFPYKTAARCVVAATAGFFAAEGAARAFADRDVSLTAAALAGIVVYAGALVVLGELRPGAHGRPHHS